MDLLTEPADGWLEPDAGTEPALMWPAGLDETETMRLRLRCDGCRRTAAPPEGNRSALSAALRRFVDAHQAHAFAVHVELLQPGVGEPHRLR